MANPVNLKDALRLPSINQLAFAAAVNELALWAKTAGGKEGISARP